MRAAFFEHGDESTDPADHWQGGVAIVNCVEDADDHGDDGDGDGDDDSGVDDDVDDCCIRTLTTAGGLAGRPPSRQSQSLGESTMMPAFVYTLFFIHHSQYHPSFLSSSIILILIHLDHPNPPGTLRALQS